MRRSDSPCDVICKALLRRLALAATHHHVHALELWHIAQKLLKHALPNKPRGTNHEHLRLSC